MKPIDINSLDQSHVYTIYQVYKSIEERLDANENKTAEDEQQLVVVKAQLEAIEQWSIAKIQEKLHWTKEELLLNYGNNPTLILDFHVGSANYKKYGKEIAVNVIFTEPELLEMLENIQNKIERKSGTVNFKVISDNSDGQLETYEIFEIGGRRV